MLFGFLDIQAQVWPDEEHIGQFLLFQTEASQLYNTSAPSNSALSQRFIVLHSIPEFWQASTQGKLYLESSKCHWGLQFTHSQLYDFFRHSYTLSFAKDIHNLRIGGLISPAFLFAPEENTSGLSDVHAALWGSWKAGDKTNMAIRVLGNTMLGFDNLPQELRIGLQHELSKRLDSYVDVIHRLDYGFFIKFALNIRINPKWDLALGTAIGERNYLMILGRKFGESTEGRLSMGIHPYFGFSTQANAYIQFGKYENTNRIRN